MDPFRGGARAAPRWDRRSRSRRLPSRRRRPGCRRDARPGRRRRPGRAGRGSPRRGATITPWASTIPVHGGSEPAATAATVRTRRSRARSSRPCTTDNMGWRSSAALLAGLEGELEQPHGALSASAGAGLRENWAVEPIGARSGEAGAGSAHRDGLYRPLVVAVVILVGPGSAGAPAAEEAARAARRPAAPATRTASLAVSDTTATTCPTASGSSTTASAASRKARAAEMSCRAAAWSGSSLSSAGPGSWLGPSVGHTNSTTSSPFSRRASVTFRVRSESGRTMHRR